MAKLTPVKRDELLIRLDERVQLIKDEDLPELKTHLSKVNAKVGKNEVRSKVNRALLTVLLGGSGAAAGVAKLVGVW